MFYNVWMLHYYRWTRDTLDGAPQVYQDPDSPDQLSLEQATQLCFRISYGDTGWCEVRPLTVYKPRKPKKVIPDFPMDTTMHPLMAGHLQDRARKLR